jgi:hypothetical protein
MATFDLPFSMLSGNQPHRQAIAPEINRMNEQACAVEWRINDYESQYSNILLKVK